MYLLDFEQETENTQSVFDSIWQRMGCSGSGMFSSMWSSVFQYFGITNYQIYDLKFKVDKLIIKDCIFGKYLNNQLYCEGKYYVWQLNVIFGNQITFSKFA